MWIGELIKSAEQTVLGSVLERTPVELANVKLNKNGP